MNTPPNRRDFCISAAALAAAAASPRMLAAADKPLITADEVARADRERILQAADAYMKEMPITVTAAHSPRSSGGAHDYFSEGDYWWPDPKNPGGPYIRRDGLSNPQNFNAHRDALIRMSLHVPALTAAWMITLQPRYAEHAALHLRAWFLDPATKMNPSLDYAQAIFGVSKGRGTGIIDTLHLIEVTRAMQHLEFAHVLSAEEFTALRAWFAQYLAWMQNSVNGKEEEATTNNHATCWAAQAAAFAVLTDNRDTMELCRGMYRNKLLPGQMAANGSFPQELARTRPYSYSIFNLDVMAILCQLISKPGAADLWQFTASQGQRMQTGMEFLYPFLADKNLWHYPKDVEYFDDLPNRQPSLLFNGIAYHDVRYIALWHTLPAMPRTPEILRNFPLRQPYLWLVPV